MNLKENNLPCHVSNRFTISCQNFCSHNTAQMKLLTLISNIIIISFYHQKFEENFNSFYKFKIQKPTSIKVIFPFIPLILSSIHETLIDRLQLVIIAQSWITLSSTLLITLTKSMTINCAPLTTRASRMPNCFPFSVQLFPYLETGTQ